MTHCVSIIMPMYNREMTIEKTINSVLHQTYSNWELIVIDDASVDRSCELVAKFAIRDSRIRLIRQKENCGPVITRNKAIRKASGRFIAFLDSDDTWHPEKLSKQVAFMLKNDCTLSCTSYHRINELGVILGQITPPQNIKYHDLLKCNWVGCLTAMYDTKKLGKVFFPNIAKRQDLGLWLEIAKRGNKVCGMEEVLADYLVQTAGSVSSNKLKAAYYQWMLYTDIEKLPLTRACYYFVCYFFNAVRNRCLGKTSGVSIWKGK